MGGEEEEREGEKKEAHDNHFCVSVYITGSHFKKEKRQMLCCCTGNPFHRAPILLKPIAHSCDSVLDANCGVVCVLYKLQLLFLRFYRVILKK